MNVLKTTVFAAALVLAGMASAGEQHEMKVRVVIADKDNGEGIHLNLDSDDLGFDLSEMQEGETRSIIDESGRSILITREATGYEFNVDGKIIDMPLFGAEHGTTWIDSEGGDNVEVHVIQDSQFVSGGLDGVTILSSQPIDEVTQEGIKSLLTSSGHSGEVEFIDTDNGPHGMHEVRIIKKEVVSEN